jgi:hypothetical protein
VQLEGLGKLKKSNDLIGNQSFILPACSIVSQPTTQHMPQFIMLMLPNSDFMFEDL